MLQVQNYLLRSILLLAGIVDGQQQLQDGLPRHLKNLHREGIVPLALLPEQVGSQFVVVEFVVVV